MNVKISDLMSKNVVTTTRVQTVGQARSLMEEYGIHALPVVNDSDKPVGIVTSIDLMNAPSDLVKVKDVMTQHILTIPQYNGPHQAARLMRKHHVHHVIVMHDKIVVGLLSSFDLLQLIEDHRFVAKNGPT
ncbi:MAG: CBS domain-containing protein [Planctomycetes bacterium]|nr:CBS domain-containing protein [Planctomycetota bacterium]